MFINKIGFQADRKGVKHKHLANACGVTIQTFSRWVNNKSQPDLKQSWVIARMLNISIDELVEVKEE
ncbi:helix-turn-helix domain-containing protein [Cytobacillus oceanisediminis]|uniref:helix-turn-helix domain-containing protein n=1 Tax=Cytobacillus oceanisediminis TaxID=665099 RepID=UPI00207AD976|nr:helix-turn-helix transcriptional regulator [Cytobacillus oceanisediminis]USK43707.1 helix-turn-helix transcriptional regulator [Cytobacillus oceanisediminis]